MDFINEDFLLQGGKARTLYHDFAADLPIIDYHCHISPAEIAADRRWDNIAQIWLGDDHYKWRAMRSNGIDEHFCTGDASDREKFGKWSETMPYLLRNPLYHWTQLELKNYFGITKLLGPDTADEIWECCNARIAEPDFSARNLIKESGVETICSTDDPTDSLEHHAAIAADADFDCRVLPTWRPDKGTMADKPRELNIWIDRLAEVADVEIDSFEKYLTALCRRHNFFHEQGCRLADHGITGFCSDEYTPDEIEKIFGELRSGRAVDAGSARKFSSAMLYELAIMNAEKGWVQQYHYGCMRNNNSRMFAARGADIGFDSIGDYSVGEAMSRHFDRLDSAGWLAKTIIYNLNPCDNELVATMLGNFQDGSVPGKMQMGSGWWFLDQKDGMERQMEALSQLGLLSRFVGMLTDSRSFLSYARHEYFRRILCNILGDDMQKGLIPDDMDMLGRMVSDISYYNARNYFGF